MNVLTFDAAEHRYALDGKPIPGVTSLLAPLYAETFARIPRAVLDAKAELGTSVHLACELDDRGTLDESSVHESVAGYLEGYRKFRREMKPTVLMNEQRLYHPTMRYAGMLDRLFLIDQLKWLTDLKACVTFYPEVGVQLAAYEKLIQANHPEHQVMQRAALKLKPNGTYQLQRFTDPADWPTFVGLLTVAQWRSRHAA